VENTVSLSYLGRAVIFAEEYSLEYRVNALFLSAFLLAALGVTLWLGYLFGSRNRRDEA
jgi:hypothetical protein